jgi:hypothetical protein
VGWQNINYIHGIDAYIIVCNYYYTIRLHMSREQLLTGISGSHQLASLFHPKVRTTTTEHKWNHLEDPFDSQADKDENKLE